eukprot:SAG11_NODE_35133_length_268_cov_0.615385_1_plen_85_part_01
MTKTMKDGASKEGSGRVGIHKATGLVHCYTLESNFCRGRSTNTVSKALGKGASRASPPRRGSSTSERYGVSAWAEVGRGVLVAQL